MKIGLTLGKFSPLHLGHQHVIETALAEMDHVIVLIYDAPEVIGCPLPIRVRWIRALYPNVEVLEAWNGPTETGLSPDITAQHDAYLQHRLASYPLTHFYSSEPYGAHVSQALNVIDRRVDQARIRYPVSASAIRSDYLRYRSFLAPVVHWDLLTKAVFVGAPSTGKTTLAQTLAEIYQTVWVPEYGREYWETHQIDRRLTLEQLVEIAVGHREREIVASVLANRFLFIDTDATTTHQFSRYYHDAVHPELLSYSDAARSRYDLRFLCEPDFPFDDTWDRSGAASRTEMQRRIEADLLAYKMPFIRLAGPLHKRVEQARKAIESFSPYVH